MDKGAHFHRCDFQVHTPRDPGWSGPRPSTDGEREQFADDFVRACREKHLNAVAITDHHDLAYVKDIRDAAKRELGDDGEPLVEADRLVVFPGIELSLGVPCQAIIIFDADFPADRFSLILEALAINAVDPAQLVLPDVTNLEHFMSLKGLYGELDKREWLRGHYIVLPNVTDHGHKTLMRTAMHGKYKEMPCVGGYLDGPIENIGTGNVNIFAGRDGKWGNKRIAVFQTSDSRSSDFTDLGKYSTWVKWAEPTAEALRQACLAQESRIAQARPAMPLVFVTRLSVSNSKFMGPIELELNPQYNAIIGGRGTGKSTILEYLRWALCDQLREGGADDELSDPAARQRRLINQTLAPYESRVDVHLLINGVPHIVRRSAASGDVQVKVSSGDFERITEADVRALLPVHAYSQKQLSSVAVRVEELTRFVTAPIQAALNQINEDMETLASRIRQNYVSLRRYRLLESNLARNQLTEASLSEQAVSIRASLEDVSPEDRTVLSHKPIYDAANELIVAWQRRLDQAQEATDNYTVELSSLIDDLPAAPNGGLPYVEGLRALADEVRELLDAMRQEGSTAAMLLESRRAVGSQYQLLMAGWNTEYLNHEARYAAVTAVSSAHESKLNQLANIEARQTAIRQSIAEQREELARLGDPLERYKSLRQEWLALLRTRSDTLQRRCGEITYLSDNLVRASLERAAGLSVLATRIRTAVSGSNLRGAKIDDLVRGLGQEPDPLSAWEEVVTELEASLRLTSESEVKPSSRVKELLVAHGMTASDVAKMVERLTPDSWLDLALTPIIDHPHFEYMATEDEYIDFSAASPGQQATALLRILLNQQGPPLIVDQPEDDLDSPVIQEIVSKIWTAKGRRQLIFTSHNANLVVNGDAELVICCDYRAMGDQSGGRIKLEGAIDVSLVRSEITQVMEGGERAFRLRKDKYGF
jgi:chromosome segregation protein